MKVVILAGGFGTRLAGETETKPKPMVEIGGRPILWHILKQVAYHGFREFLIATGYRSEVIKRYFMHYYPLAGDLTVDLSEGRVDVRRTACERWLLHLVDTGLHTNTGGRVARLKERLGDEPFLLTYGDGVSDVDLQALKAFHESHGLLATVTAVRPPARFGGLLLDGARVQEFTEKPQIGSGWINGGFMMLSPGVFDYLDGDDTSLEAHALNRIAADGQLAAFRHEGFWQCVDTPRDRRLLERLWESDPPWRVWQ